METQFNKWRDHINSIAVTFLTSVFHSALDIYHTQLDGTVPTEVRQASYYRLSSSCTRRSSPFALMLLLFHHRSATYPNWRCLTLRGAVFLGPFPVKCATFDELERCMCCGPIICRATTLPFHATVARMDATVKRENAAILPQEFVATYKRMAVLASLSKMEQRRTPGKKK